MRETVWWYIITPMSTNEKAFYGSRSFTIFLALRLRCSSIAA